MLQWRHVSLLLLCCSAERFLLAISSLCRRDLPSLYTIGLFQVKEYYEEFYLHSHIWHPVVYVTSI
jgi:hypothetical protein